MLADFQPKAQGVINHFVEELKKVRTGRAQPSMVDSVLVEVSAYGGAQMKVNELATITAPDPGLLLIQPFDPSVIKDIERGIAMANLGFNPVVDQNIVRIVIPPLTGERREQLIKLVEKMKHEAEEAMRSVRRDVKESIEALQGVSEDEISRQLKELQVQVDQAVARLTKLQDEKIAELKQI